jgi:hypothetical protein
MLENTVSVTVRVMASGLPGARSMPTTNLEKIVNFPYRVHELPPEVGLRIAARREIGSTAEDDLGVAPSGRSELYRGRAIDILPSKTGFDVHLDGKPRMHSFETAEDAMAAAKEYIDALIAYRERTDSESVNWEANRLEAEADEAARSWGEDLYH